MMESNQKQTKKRTIKNEPSSDVKKRKLNVSDTVNTKKKLLKESKEHEPLEIASCSFNNFTNETGCEEYVLLAEQHNFDVNVAKSIIKLFEDGNTIPFIARYRRNLTNNMSPEELRDVKNTYDSILNLKSKIQTVLKTIEKSGKLDAAVKRSVLSARSLDELDYIYAPFKPESKRTLANRAKELGLEEPALYLLNNKDVALTSYINSSNADLDNLEKVRKGIMHIIASIISTDSEMLNFIHKLRSETNFVIKTKQAKKTSKTIAKTQKDGVDETKFENYFDFTIPIKYIKPHQILAINRGELQKVLSVKIEVPDWFYNQFKKFCTQKWIQAKVFKQEAKELIFEAIEDAYTRLVQPLIIREVRNDLKKSAEKASCDVFSTNLKHLLLAQPLKGRRILAIDPGFKNGCKVAIVSETGSALEYTVIYPVKENKKAADTLKNLLQKYGCNLIALGNGTACRETEEWISKLIEMHTFSPLDVTYTIVNENGVSIYSCSTEAKKEFPGLDPNMISAISLARRVQDPLAELVKVEPRHLGIGMYQHDLKAVKLKEALDEVVSECVSFVGVDLNTASQCLLRHVAGLSQNRAQLIVEYREKHGIFTSRAQLKNIKTIGNQTFQQCVGFLRVGPTDNEEDFYKLPDTNRVDRTYIHVESYETAQKLIKLLALDSKDIGQSDFIETVQSKTNNIAELSQKLNSPEETIKLIVDALSKPLNYDLRVNFKEPPLFKKGLTKITDLTESSILTGRVNNVTHFGCFVDIGVGTNGLIHKSKMKGIDFQIGDKVEVKVLNIDIQRKRIQLETIRKLC